MVQQHKNTVAEPKTERVNQGLLSELSEAMELMGSTKELHGRPVVQELVSGW